MDKINNIKHRLFIKAILSIVFIISSITITGILFGHIITSDSPFIIILLVIIFNSLLNTFIIFVVMSKCNNGDKEKLELEKCIV